MGHYASEMITEEDDAIRRARAAKLDRMERILFKALLAGCEDSDKDVACARDMAERLVHSITKGY